MAGAATIAAHIVGNPQYHRTFLTMPAPGCSHRVAFMTTSPGTTSPHQHATQANVFADLRRRNEYAAHVARMLSPDRQRRIDQAIRAQRVHPVHPSR